MLQQSIQAQIVREQVKNYYKKITLILIAGLCKN